MAIIDPNKVRIEASFDTELVPGLKQSLESVGILTTHTFGGYGPDFINLTRNQDLYIWQMGLDGKGNRIPLSDKSGVIEVSFTGNSDTNNFLTIVANLFSNGGIGGFNLSITTDPMIKEKKKKTLCTNVLPVKMPDENYNLTETNAYVNWQLGAEAIVTTYS